MSRAYLRVSLSLSPDLLLSIAISIVFSSNGLVGSSWLLKRFCRRALASERKLPALRARRLALISSPFVSTFSISVDLVLARRHSDPAEASQSGISSAPVSPFSVRVADCRKQPSRPKANGEAVRVTFDDDGGCLKEAALFSLSFGRGATALKGDWERPTIQARNPNATTTAPPGWGWTGPSRRCRKELKGRLRATGERCF